MTFANPIMAAGVRGLQSLYAERAVTPVEATEAYLSRIRGLDGALGCYVHVDAEGARAAAHASAARWHDGAAFSPLDGVPIAVKANIALKAAPWHAGMGVHKDRIAEEDAECVARLRATGAVILGVLNMHEGAFGATTDNPWFGRTHNPWKHGFTAGGSSGGSGAATAAGLCAAALGTDTLGSVRIPASFTGTVGHKPTQGLISTAGVVPMSWTLDHVGVHARSVEDCGLLLAGACGADGELAGDIASPAGIATLTSAPYAVLDFDAVAQVSPAQARALHAAVERGIAAGLSFETIDLKGYDFAAAVAAGVLICAAENAVVHAEALAASPDGFSEGYKAILAMGAARSAPDLARAYRDLAAMAEAAREALSGYAGLILPTTPDPACAFEETPREVALFTALGNALGLPVTAFPTGFDADAGGGLPLSASALAWDDETALGLAQIMAQDFEAPGDYRG